MKAGLLHNFGYTESINELISERHGNLEQVARVTAEHKGGYIILLNSGEFRGIIPGKQMQIRHERQDYPLVGDWVLVKDAPDDIKVIQEILPRKTVLYKKYSGKNEKQFIAANVDVAFIVESIDRDYNLNRFERYIILAKEGGVRPVIVLNKSDVSSPDTLAFVLKSTQERFEGIDVLLASTVTEKGLDSLRKYLRTGNTYCFLGSSGVGKSSLINKLLNQSTIDTKAISKKSGRGKHTTTSRELYALHNGSIVMDNPGSRAVGVGNAEGGIHKTFNSIEAIAQGCRFADCTHLTEPECAVLAALKTKSVDTKQYENYQKLTKEAKYYTLDLYGKRQKDKKFGKYIKTAKKELKKYKS